MECRDRAEVHALSNMGSLLAQLPWGFRDPPAPAKLQNNESVAAKPLVRGQKSVECDPEPQASLNHLRLLFL